MVTKTQKILPQSSQTEWKVLTGLRAIEMIWYSDGRKEDERKGEKSTAAYASIISGFCWYIQNPCTPTSCSWI